MYLSFMGTSAVIFTLTSLAVLCVSSTSLSSSSSSLNEDGSLHHVAPVKRGIDPVGSWLLKRRINDSPSSASSIYASQGQQNWPAGEGRGGTGAEQEARRISQGENEFAEEEDVEQEDAEQEGPIKRRIDPVGSYLLKKRRIDPVGSYLLRKKNGDGYASLESGANE